MKVFYLKGWVPVEDTETDTVPLCPFGFRVYAISIEDAIATIRKKKPDADITEATCEHTVDMVSDAVLETLRKPAMEA